MKKEVSWDYSKIPEGGFPLSKFSHTYHAMATPAPTKEAAIEEFRKTFGVSPTKIETYFSMVYDSRDVIKEYIEGNESFYRDGYGRGT